MSDAPRVLLAAPLRHGRIPHHANGFALRAEHGSVRVAEGGCEVDASSPERLALRVVSAG